MKAIACLVLIGLLAVAQGDFQDCTYTTFDANGNSLYYSLVPLEYTAYTYGSSINGVATSLSFSVCGPLSDTVELQCEDGSAACYFPTADDHSVAGINIGNWEDTLFSDSELGADQGVELVYSSPNTTTCNSDGRRYKTVLKLICQADVEFVIQSVENPTDCDTVITVQSEHACPAVAEGSSGSSGVVSAQPAIGRKCAGKKLGLVIFGLATLCCCCVCCCVRRRRRCAMMRRQREQQQAAAVELTNVSFQPIPQQQQTQVQMVPPQFMYPQQMAPQYFYMQPQVVQPQVQLQPVVQRDDQVEADEKLAKALQAHFDQE